MQPAPENGVDSHGARSGALARISACQQGVFSQIIGGQHLHLVKGLYCSLTLTQHILGTQNGKEGREIMSIYLCMYTTTIQINVQRNEKGVRKKQQENKKQMSVAQGQVFGLLAFNGQQQQQGQNLSLKQLCPVVNDSLNS